VADSLLRPYWIWTRGDAPRAFHAHRAEQTASDLMLFTTPAGSAARTIVAHYPLEMIEAWGEGLPPDPITSAARIP
jgi:hypothetical protein